MPTGALHAVVAAAAVPQHHEAALPPGPLEPWTAPALGGPAPAGGRQTRCRHTSFIMDFQGGSSAVSSISDAAQKTAEKGADATAVGANQALKTGDAAGGSGEDKPNGQESDPSKASRDSNGRVLLYTSQTGKTVELSGESKYKCIQSCKDAPELKDENQSGVNEVMAVATGGEKEAVGDCEQFCNEQFALWCFPGDSSVVVRDRGSVRLADLQVGDAVLALDSRRPDARGQQADTGGRWELLFDTVITWIHRAPDAEGEVLRIRHDAGQVQLTASHFLFVRKPGREVAVPCRAEEVRPGDRLLAPWIDGSLAEPVVLSVDQVWKRGLYAPLVGCGTVFVDGTAASCYALPENLHASPVFRHVSRLADGRGLHAAAHALFLPLRLLHSAVGTHGAAGPGLVRRLPAGAPRAAGDEEERRRLEAVPCCKAAAALRDHSPQAPIHPYAWVLYVLASSFLT